MNDLKNLLQGAGEAKWQLFASEDFVSGYGRVVTSRVKRRRAVSATAMGGGTVVAVGALAVGAANMPWTSWVMGASPSGSPSVVCTTSTPDAVAGADVDSETHFAGAATRVLEDLATGSAFFIGPVDGVARAWHPDGSSASLVPSGDHSWQLTLPSGELVTLETGTDDSQFNIVATHGAAVSVLSVDDYLDEAASALSVVSEDGTVLGSAIHTSPDALAFVADGKLYPLADADGHAYSYVDGSGESHRVTLVANHPAVAASQPAATPVVTCVTTSPEPTASASPSTSSDAPIVASPFQCGSELASDEYGTAQLSIGNVEWLTAADVNAQLDMSYMGGKAPYGATGSGPVARVIVSDTRPLRSGEQIGITTSDASDPVETETSASLDDAQGLAVAVLGTSFVAIRDGVVVATVPGDLGDQDHAIYIEPNATDLGVTATFLNPDGAFTACAGETLASDWDLYAVAGQLFAYPDGSLDEPIYAWHKIDPAG